MLVLGGGGGGWLRTSLDTRKGGSEKIGLGGGGL